MRALDKMVYGSISRRRHSQEACLESILAWPDATRAKPHEPSRAPGMTSSAGPRAVEYRAAIPARIRRIQGICPGGGIIPGHDVFATRSGEEQEWRREAI